MENRILETCKPLEKLDTGQPSEQLEIGMDQWKLGQLWVFGDDCEPLRPQCPFERLGGLCHEGYSQAGRIVSVEYQGSEADLPG